MAHLRWHDMSTLYVNNIAPKTGNTINITGAFNGGGGGNVKEILAMVCDGGSYTVGSGTYTSQNVTATYLASTTYVDLTGSVVNYTPPSGTTCVIYEFQFQVATGGVAHAILHNKFFIDGTEVTDSKREIAGGSYPEYSAIIRQVIPIGGAANAATGRQASWTGAKELKVQSRSYSDPGNVMRIHGTYYWEGATSTVFVRPNITITAIGS